MLNEGGRVVGTGKLLYLARLVCLGRRRENPGEACFLTDDGKCFTLVRGSDGCERRTQKLGGVLRANLLTIPLKKLSCHSPHPWVGSDEFCETGIVLAQQVKQRGRSVLRRINELNKCVRLALFGGPELKIFRA